MLKLAVSLLLTALAGYGVFAFAQGRTDLRTAVTPIGSSSSDGISFAWFYDPAERTVYVCRMSHGADAPECKGKAVLP
ncbi:MAG: hypothetical protein WCA12_13810 [Burkholderiales bacterium]